MLEVKNLVQAGETSHFPFVWLRDNCICKACFHSKSSSRLTSFSRLDVSDSLVSAERAVAGVQDTRLGRVTEVTQSDGHAPVNGGAVAAGAAPPAAEMDCIKLSWSSGHESTFPLKWLEERCFSEAKRKLRSSDMDTFSLLESASVPLGYNDASVRSSAVAISGTREAQAREIPRFRYTALTDTSDPGTMLGWCHALEKYGVALVSTDNHAGALKHFTQLFGFREWCSYGEFYLVENKQAAPLDAGETGMEANNLAYTGLPLAFHTDLPHYASPPQVQLLHCISQCSCDGGSNKLVDGFAVAEQLRRESPRAFELLASVRMMYKDYHRETLWDSGPGGDEGSDGTALGARPNDTPRLGNRREVDFFLRYAHPVISVADPRDVNSPVVRINYSDHHRDSVLNDVSAETVKEYYHACKLWDALLNEPSNTIWNKSAPGEILCFDNRRVLHGRSGFQVQAGETRKLIGTYLRWDEVRSMARVKAARAFPDRLV